MPGLTALVPLDGTRLSESAFALLPVVQKLGVANVRLVSAWEESWSEAENIPGRAEGELKEVAERGRSYLEAYLNQQADVVRRIGFEVETKVLIGRAADGILEMAESKADPIDIIVIATHGRSGIERWRLGSVADKIIRNASCPTLVIGPNVKEELAPYVMRRILVPVDGSELSEAALPMATWIADAFSAELDLARVVSLTPIAMDQSMGVYPVDLLSAMEDAAGAYLQKVKQDLDAKRKITTSLLIGNAGEQLLEYIKQTPASLVVMASHGRAGVVRAALGSVADRMLHGPAPVLVFRPDESTGRLYAAAKAATASS
jgi:nucleotide-binding universal stress UspA family protein